MYRKDSERWLKHIDFIVLDMICLQLAYVLAYAISGYGFNPYEKKTMKVWWQRIWAILIIGAVRLRMPLLR